MSEDIVGLSEHKRMPRPSFVVSDEGVAAPAAGLPVIPWHHIAAIRVLDPAEVYGRRIAQVDAVNAEPIRRAMPARVRLLGRMSLWWAGSGVLWLHESKSPIPLEDLVAEMHRRFEVAVGRSLPPISILRSGGPGILARLRRASPKVRLRYLARLLAVFLVAAVVMAVVMALLPPRGGLFGGIELGILIPQVTGFAAWWLERPPAGLGTILLHRLPASILVAGIFVLAWALTYL